MLFKDGNYKDSFILFFSLMIRGIFRFVEMSINTKFLSQTILKRHPTLFCCI
jgi:hypothetical protein